MTSSFAHDVAADLGVSSDADAVAEVADILATYGVVPAPTPPVPRRIRLDTLKFTGIKPITGVHDDMDDSIQLTEPIDFSWTFGDGVHVIGSHENFRGKSSVMHLIMWCLRGRCGLQDDVRHWMRYVELTFTIADEPIAVRFEVAAGNTAGVVIRTGNPEVQLAEFASQAEFEEAMNDILMARLGLTAIRSWDTGSGPDGRAVAHTWPTYAGSLMVTAASLDNVLGDISFAGLPGRLLHMFIGTPWASTYVEAQVAARTAGAELTGVHRRAEKDSEANDAERDRLAGELAEAQLTRTVLVAGGNALSSLTDAAMDMSSLSQSAAELRAARADALIRAAEILAQINAEREQRLDGTEDALLKRFFHNIEPTACPRCSAPVTKERRDREPERHTCSVCDSDLDLDAYLADEIEALAAHTDTSADLGDADGDGEDNLIDPIEALQAAFDEVDRVRAELDQRLTDTEQRLGAATLLVNSGMQAGSDLSHRHDLDLTIARLEGALAQADRVAGRAADSPDVVLQRKVGVLVAAESLGRQRVQAGQLTLLDSVSTEILRLGQLFGIEALEHVKLRGNAVMEIRKGGERTYYSKCTLGEKLRLKVATVIALLRIGFTTGVGRHPGLLLVDSPGAEEATPENADAMMTPLVEVATEIPELQIIIGTQSPQLLQALLDPSRVRVAAGGAYLW